MPRTILNSITIDVPEGVEVTLAGRRVTVRGKRGILKRDFSHTKIDLRFVGNGKKILAELWFANAKAQAVIRSVTSHIKNMFTGVTKGFRYKMRLVYAHFPINVAIEEQGTKVAIRNFLGEKVVRNVSMLDGVTITKSSDVKDELVLEGNDIDNVSTSASQIHHVAKVRNKDIRKFLDGIYTSEAGVIEADE